MGLRADRAALRRLNSADITLPEIVEIFSDTAYDGEVRAAAIRHPACTLESLSPVLDVGSAPTLDRIAIESMDPDVLAHVARQGPPDRRAMVAYNPFSPPWLLDELAGDPDPLVRANVHVNPATPPNALLLLANDNDEDVRAARDDWQQLVEDHNADLRCRIQDLVLTIQSWARHWLV